MNPANKNMQQTLTFVNVIFLKDNYLKNIVGMLSSESAKCIPIFKLAV